MKQITYRVMTPAILYGSEICGSKAKGAFNKVIPGCINGDK